MKAIKLILLIAALCMIGLQASLCATKTYQVTGPVLEITDKMIVIQKGDERWEISRDEARQFTGVIKVGDVVTVRYRMVATEIEPKPAREPKKSR